MDEKQRKIWKLKQKNDTESYHSRNLYLRFISAARRKGLIDYVSLCWLCFTCCCSHYLGYQFHQLCWIIIDWLIWFDLSHSMNDYWKKLLSTLDNSKTKQQMIKSISDGSIIGYGNYHHHHHRFDLISDFLKTEKKRFLTTFLQLHLT